MNQIDIPDYQYHLGCDTKRMARLAFLEKKFLFQSEISTFSLILFLKIEKFRRVKELFKSNQTRYRVSPGYVESKTERIFGKACLGKNSYFNRKYRLIRLLFAYSIFKHIEITSGQGVVQIKPNSAWSIPSVFRV